MIAMIDHIKLLIVLGNLILGAAMAAYLHQTWRRYALAPLRPIFFNSVFFNLLVLTLFVSKYYALNIRPASLGLTPEWRETLVLTLMYLFLMGFSYASLGTYCAFMEKRISRRAALWAGVASVALVAGVPLGHFLPAGSLAKLVHHHFYENFGVVFLALELGLTIALPIKGSKLADRERARLMKSYGLLYVSRYPAVAAIILLPQPFRLLFALLYLNLVPWLWLRFFALPKIEGDMTRAAAGVNVDAIVERYGLSPREKEILALILAGKSNRDMEEALFISYHTVKNHVYNIYRKLGVKTRFELLHLVSGSRPAKST